MIRNTDTEIIDIIKNYKNINWLEIGVFKGQNPKFVLNSFDIDKIHLIDPYIPLDYLPQYFGTKEMVNTSKEESESLLIKHKDKCVWYQDFSENVVHKFDEESIDIIYIDGNHSYDAILRDLENYYDKIKKGGLIIGDDYNEPGVKKAIEEFAKKMNIVYQTITKYPNPPPTHKFWFKK